MILSIDYSNIENYGFILKHDLEKIVLFLIFFSEKNKQTTILYAH